MSSLIGASRHIDLMRQGFMKPRRDRTVRVKGPTVACDWCQDWHEKGHHRKPVPKGMKVTQREIGP